MNLQQRYEVYRHMVEDFLVENLSDERCPGQEGLAQAMRYSALEGGKRLRPILVLEFCRLSGGNPEDALPFAAAVEMIHTYSLVHDDLPCMDNDDLRRGKPTSHKAYGEAMAVLVGDALLTRAFEVMLFGQGSRVPVKRVLDAAGILARQSGIMGMVGGQVLDIKGETSKPGLDDLIHLQSLKTGALIQACAQIGCIIGGASREQIRSAEEYAAALGLAFQIRDDMLDIEGDQTLLGKAVGMDKARDKATFPALLGMEACEERVDELTNRAVEALSSFQKADFLIELALCLAKRNK